MNSFNLGHTANQPNDDSGLCWHWAGLVNALSPHWFGIWVILLGGVVGASAMDFAQPELVREVMAGQRREARVSWWGFAAQDSTAYLQQAIHSKVPRLIIDRQTSAWVTRPLTGVSHPEIVLESGVEVVALPGGFRGTSDCLLEFKECEEVILRGEKGATGQAPILRMWKEDYQSAPYEKSEWRHGLVFLGCKKVLVEDLVIEKTGGDGIYLGVTFAKVPNRELTIRRVDCRGNHRQGISVISAVNLLIEDCRLSDTAGTEPQAGIDFEPNSPADSLVNCVVRRCLAENNAGTGFQICPQYQHRNSLPLSIELIDCVSRQNRQHGVHLCSAQQDPPTGRLRLVRFVSEKDGMAGFSSQFNPWDAIQVEIEAASLLSCAETNAFFPPIYVQGLDSDNRPPGGIHFQNVLVRDEVERPLMKIRAHNGIRAKAMTGQIILERHGQRETNLLDDAWLEKMQAAANK